MFHKHYQRLTELTSTEESRLVFALNNPFVDLSGVGVRLAERSQAAAQRYLHAGVEGRAAGAEARKCLEAAVAVLRGAYIASKEPVYALKRAEYCMYLERYAEATEILREAIAVTPDDVRLIYALATVYRILGRARAHEVERMYPGPTKLMASPAIEAACSDLGLSADDARRLAADHFARVLTMNVAPRERKSVEESLQVVRAMLQVTV